MKLYTINYVQVSECEFRFTLWCKLTEAFNGDRKRACIECARLYAGGGGHRRNINLILDNQRFKAVVV